MIDRFRTLVNGTRIAVVVLLCLPLFAAQPPGRDTAPQRTIILVDLARGTALVPEGVSLPATRIAVRRQVRELVQGAATPRSTDDTVEPFRTLRYEHASDSAFEKARAAVTAHDEAERRLHRATTFDYYNAFTVYFTDIDAYLQARLYPGYPFAQAMGAQTYMFIAARSSLASATLYGTQWSDQSPDWYHTTCAASYTNASDAACVTSIFSDSPSSATVYFDGRIQGRTFDGCGLYGAAQCNVTYEATIVGSFSWLSESSTFSTSFSPE